MKNIANLKTTISSRLHGTTIILGTKADTGFTPVDNSDTSTVAGQTIATMIVSGNLTITQAPAQAGFLFNMI